MILARAQTLLTMHEGCKLAPYTCPAGKLTIGVGRNLEAKGISQSEALFMLENDIRECDQDLVKIFPHQFHSFPEDIQLVLIDMRFQLGPGGFRGFFNMIKAFQDWDYLEAIRQMKESQWYVQVTDRAKNLIEMVEKQIIKE